MNEYYTSDSQFLLIFLLASHWVSQSQLSSWQFFTHTLVVYLRVLFHVGCWSVVRWSVFHIHHFLGSSSWSIHGVFRFRWSIEKFCFHIQEVDLLIIRYILLSSGSQNISFSTLPFLSPFLQWPTCIGWPTFQDPCILLKFLGATESVLSINCTFVSNHQFPYLLSQYRICN